MEQRFVETIKIEDGRAERLPYHQARMERTISRFFPQLAEKSMPSLENLLDPREEMDFFKARVVYGAEGVEKVEYAPYSMREIRSLRTVTDDSIDYSFKSLDRTRLNELLAQKGSSDDIIIVKNGLVTDTSFTNLAILSGNRWLTPRHPLLAGTMRSFLLDKGIITEADISLHDLKNAQAVSLFNAMIEFGERVVDCKDIE